MARMIAIVIGAVVLVATSWAQETRLVDQNSEGRHGNSAGDLPVTPDRVLSMDGRYIAFVSSATNLVPDDTNGSWDVFVRDTIDATTERISVASSGEQANGPSGVYGVSISPDGRFVAFESRATNLVAGDANGRSDVYVRDRRLRTTELVSVDSSGMQGDSSSRFPSISADGRFVAFTSEATNLVPGDTNGVSDVFVRDRANGVTERVSVSTSGIQGDLGSSGGTISADGRFVAFESRASNLVAGDTNGACDVFVHDRTTGHTDRISVGYHGIEGNGDSYGASITADGQRIAFTSTASNLVAGDTNSASDVFVSSPSYPGYTDRISLGHSNVQGNAASYGAAISLDGQFVAFTSRADNLVNGDMNDADDVFVYGFWGGQTRLASVGASGEQGNEPSGRASISGDGRFVAFASDASDLVPDDANRSTDVFVRDRNPTGFVSVCHPGFDGVARCPCSNLGIGEGWGCANFMFGDGGQLTASGTAYLSNDTLEFTASYLPRSASSVLFQSRNFVSAGRRYGQGISCLGPPLLRLCAGRVTYFAIRLPDLAAGDARVSDRSRSRGDVIGVAETRWYCVGYRDRFVQGGCPASSTYNVTQAGRITWWP